METLWPKKISNNQIFHMQCKILMKSQNKSRRKISRFSESAVEKGMWEINPDLQEQKSGVFVLLIQ